MSDMITEKTAERETLPSWFRQDIPDPAALQKIRDVLKEAQLLTVCESAHCPNSGQCWQAGVVTVMILGDTCTRRCGFCAVKTGNPDDIDPLEPQRVAGLVETLKLSYVVVTSVTRDDLADGGARHFAHTVEAIRSQRPQTKIEILIPDFSGRENALRVVLGAGSEVVSHNVEMVPRLYPRLRPQAAYEQSLNILRGIGRFGSISLVKSGFMVGLGETDEEVKGLLADLAHVGCDIVTIGQYLSPSKRHASVSRFVDPEMFSRYQEWGEAVGIPVVVSGPLVRSSYMAEEGLTRFQQRNENRTL